MSKRHTDPSAVCISPTTGGKAFKAVYSSGAGVSLWLDIPPFFFRDDGGDDDGDDDGNDNCDEKHNDKPVCSQVK